MIKRLLLSVVTVGAVTTAQAQSGFTPGYVVTMSGDSLRGEVDVRGMSQNAEQCLFRASSGATSTEYLPQQLRAYGLYNPKRRYESRALASGKMVYAQVVFKGRLSLYIVPQANQNVGYFAGRQPNAALVKLTQRDTVEVVYDNRQQREVSVKKRFPLYQTALLGLMEDCFPAREQISRTQLTKSSLTDLFAVYNTCNQPDAKVTSTAAPDTYRRVRPEILLGVGTDRITYAEYPAFSSTTQVQAGLGLKFNPELFNPRLSLHLQALYSRTQLKETIEVAAGGIFQGQTTREDVYARFNTIQIPLMLRVELSRRTIVPYVQAGPVAALNTGREAYRDYYQPNSSAVARANYDIHSFSLGAIGAAGISVPAGALGRAQLEARMALLGGLTEQKGVLGAHTRWSVLTGFTFGR